jgi:5-methylcytosine-specific restriction endonuclease McrA
MSCCGGNRGKVNVNRYRENTKKTNERGKPSQKKDSKIVSDQLREN